MKPKPSLELSGYQIRQGYNQRLFLSCTLPEETSTVSELRLTHTHTQTLDIVENLSPQTKVISRGHALGFDLKTAFYPTSVL